MSNKQQIKIDNFFRKLLKELQITETINDFELLAFETLVNKENPDQIINSIKKTGFFRPSKYDFNVKTILFLLNIMKKNTKFNSFNCYFLQIDCLLTLAKEMQRSLKKIREILLSNNNLVKFLFAKADDVFYENAGKSNPEIILECISFLILECRKNQYSHGINLTFISTLNEADFNKLIKLSKEILIFKKMEIKLDFFGYEIKQKNKHTYLLSNPSFEKNLSFSYLNYDLQRYVIQKKTLDDTDNEKTFSEIINKFVKKLNTQSIADIRKEPFTRICVKFILHPSIIELFTTNYIYLDERYALNSFFQDNFLDATDINLRIYKDFTLLDIIKVQRFYKYLSIVYRQVIVNKFNNKKNKKIVLLSSIIPITTKSELNKTLNKIYGTTNKNFYEIIYDLMSIDFYKLDDFLDIQYNPAIAFGNELLVSPSILSESNLIRSCLLKLNINLSIKEKNDQMISLIKEKLVKSGFSVGIEVKIGEFEIDIIAKKGTEVFIFECKNCYHPVNEFGLRNVYSHIVKASNQLENLKIKISDTPTRRNLSRNIGFSLYKCNFHYAIINSNRIFNGYLQNNYRCINSNILMNLLDEGTIRINNNKYSLWQNSNFNEYDLVSIINGKFISDYEKLAHEDVLTYKLQNCTLNLQRFGYNLEELVENIKCKYKRIN